MDTELRGWTQKIYLQLDQASAGALSAKERVACPESKSTRAIAEISLGRYEKVREYIGNGIKLPVGDLARGFGSWVVEV